jgi:hypothetical protein
MKNISCSFSNLTEYYSESKLDVAIALLKKDLEEYKEVKENERKIIQDRFPGILEYEAVKDIENNIKKLKDLSHLRMAQPKSEIYKNLIDIHNKDFITEIAIWLNKQKVFI